MDTLPGIDIGEAASLHREETAAAPFRACRPVERASPPAAFRGTAPIESEPRIGKSSIQFSVI
jgi:hypothetical protein